MNLSQINLVTDTVDEATLARIENRT